MSAGASHEGQELNSEEFALSVCARPEMYVYKPTFLGVCAYLQGFDRGVLAGFREWLVLRANGGDNLCWEPLVERELSVEIQGGDDRAIAALGPLLQEFFEHRRSVGQAKVFEDHADWLRRRFPDSYRDKK